MDKIRKVRPITGHERPEGKQKYSSTLSLTSALDGVGGQHDALAALPPGRDAVPVVLEGGGGPQYRSGQVWKIAPSPAFELSST